MRVRGFFPILHIGNRGLPLVMSDLASRIHVDDTDTGNKGSEAGEHIVATGIAGVNHGGRPSVSHRASATLVWRPFR